MLDRLVSIVQGDRGVHEALAAAGLPGGGGPGSAGTLAGAVEQALLLRDAGAFSEAVSQLADTSVEVSGAGGRQGGRAAQRRRCGVPVCACRAARRHQPPPRPRAGVATSSLRRHSGWQL